MQAQWSTTTEALCHRCGRPGCDTYIAGRPTCNWCLAELQRPFPVIAPTPLNDWQPLVAEWEGEGL